MFINGIACLWSSCLHCQIYDHFCRAVYAQCFSLNLRDRASVCSILYWWHYLKKTN